MVARESCDWDSRAATAGSRHRGQPETCCPLASRTPPQHMQPARGEGHVWGRGIMYMYMSL